MLIDDFMPEYDFHERHRTIISAPADAVRDAVDNWTPASSFSWRWLLRLRGLGSPQGNLRRWAEGNGFLCLAKNDNETVYGQAGRFWAIDERRALVGPRTVEEFRALDDPRLAVTAMNILIEELSPARTRLSTETRVHPLGAGARRRFRLYWLLVRPFSGLLRRSLLGGVAAQAIRGEITSKPAEKAKKITLENESAKGAGNET